MKFLLLLAFILSVCSLSCALVTLKLFKDPAHPGKCVYDNYVLSVGEKAKLHNDCALIVCGRESFGVIQTCDPMDPPPGCKFTEYINIHAPFGECCAKKLVCA
ncbi:uncharacterized protein LOC135963761 isoform X3 [Calliphora vicina]|uniref:uncharacterized protein LOC135963761 isoform X3 n=1 Tax=Calliphora vicina TaxID=7373 RepID=UPI00325BFC2A